jgi:hypothetical protein
MDVLADRVTSMGSRVRGSDEGLTIAAADCIARS